MNDKLKFHDQDELRFVEAINFGLYADRLFEEVCRRHGLPLEKCYEAPLMTLAAAITTQTKH